MRSFKKYWITLIVGLLMVFIFALSRDVFHQESAAQVFAILYDAFFVAGAALIGSGLMVFVTNEGTFDLLVYGVKSTANVLRKNDIKKYDTYYDYRMARAAKKFPFLFLVICGGSFVAVAIIIGFFLRW